MNFVVSDKHNAPEAWNTVSVSRHGGNYHFLVLKPENESDKAPKFIRALVVDFVKGAEVEERYLPTWQFFKHKDQNGSFSFKPTLAELIRGAHANRTDCPTYFLENGAYRAIWFLIIDNPNRPGMPGYTDESMPMLLTELVKVFVAANEQDKLFGKDLAERLKTDCYVTVAFVQSTPQSGPLNIGNDIRNSLTLSDENPTPINWFSYQATPELDGGGCALSHPILLNQGLSAVVQTDAMARAATTNADNARTCAMIKVTAYGNGMQLIDLSAPHAAPDE